MSQSYTIWMLANASDFQSQAPADSSVQKPSNTAEIDSLVKLKISSWYLYSDSDEGGNSIARWEDLSAHKAYFEPKAGAEYPYAGAGFEIQSRNSDMSAFDGMLFYGTFEEGVSYRIEIGCTGKLYLYRNCETGNNTN